MTTKQLTAEERLAAVEECTNKKGEFKAEIYRVYEEGGKIKYEFMLPWGKLIQRTYNEPRTLADNTKHLDICSYLDMPIHDFSALEGSKIPMIQDEDGYHLDLPEPREKTKKAIGEAIGISLLAVFNPALFLWATPIIFNFDNKINIHIYEFMFWVSAASTVVWWYVAVSWITTNIL